MGSDLHMDAGRYDNGYFHGYQQAIRDIGKAVGELEPNQLTLAQVQRALATVRKQGPVNPLNPLEGLRS